VRFDQVAVRTTFGSATADSVIDKPGIRLRLPWPFQQVYQYSTRLQLAETSFGQVLTTEGYSVIVKTYMTWRIKEPLKFYEKIGEEEKARDAVTALLGTISGQVTNNVKFSEMVNTDPGKIKLKEAETALLAQVQAELARLDYGIVAEHAGIHRIVLPEQVTPKVFDRMKSDRENRAASARSRGAAEASALVSSASSVRRILLSFAGRYAEEIRTRGLTQAAEENKVFAKDEQFAIYLRQMEALEKILKINTTFVIDANKVGEYSPLRLLVQDPGSGPKPPLK
jgi:membrane protease subunit HflC